MPAFSYPQPPAPAAKDITLPSPEFRKNVARVTTHIALFALLYLILLAAGVALAAVLAWLGGWIVFYIHSSIAIVLGLGLIGVGVMVCFFLIKFLFATRKENHENAIEATEADYPELFRFIRLVSEETGTDFPKHIYLNAEVNAFVSYDSNIKSLLLPVRKNLTIGLGLVNMVNLSEFKAILAHEFGHFSQKSMRAGSYVYQVNKVIYNLLYENNSYSAALSHWGRVHWAFAICANMTAKIVTGIQWLLRGAYKAVNKSYLSLSRQMEFHADAVAAQAAGSNNAIHALRRIEFADACYNQTISKYNNWLSMNYKATNLFSQQRLTGAFIAESLQLPLANGLPLLHEADKHYQSYSRLNIDNQWASHPTRSQREAALNALQTTAEVVDEPAWLLFGKNTDALQRQFTDQLYKSVRFNNNSLELSDELFAEQYRKEQVDNNYPSWYHGYYDGRSIAVTDVDALTPSLFPDIESFLETHKDIQAKITAAKADIALLDHISNKKNQITHFDFDGEKYRRKDTGIIGMKIRQQLEAIEQSIKTNDEQVAGHFLALAAQQNDAAVQQLKTAYREYSRLQQLTAENMAAAENLLGLITPITQGSNFTKDTARQLCSDLATGTGHFIQRVRKVRDELDNFTGIEKPIPEETWSLTNEFYTYWSFDHFRDNELKHTWEAAVAFGHWSYQLQFSAQKKLLEQQLVLWGPIASAPTL